jgi:putative endonuclease
MAHFVYIVCCNDGTLYTGYATDVEKRIKEHNNGSGEGAKYTRSRLPVHLLYSEEQHSRSEAQSREYAIKQLNRDQKLELINSSKKSRK